MTFGTVTTWTGTVLFATAVIAQSCSTTVTGSVPAPSVASGYSVQLVATGLSTPRGIIFDNAGNLLVVEKNKGVTALTFENQGGNSDCVSLKSQKQVISNDAVCFAHSSLCDVYGQQIADIHLSFSTVESWY